MKNKNTKFGTKLQENSYIFETGNLIFTTEEIIKKDEINDEIPLYPIEECEKRSSVDDLLDYITFALAENSEMMNRRHELIRYEFFTIILIHQISCIIAPILRRMRSFHQPAILISDSHGKGKTSQVTFWASFLANDDGDPTFIRASTKYKDTEQFFNQLNGCYVLLDDIFAAESEKTGQALKQKFDLIRETHARQLNCFPIIMSETKTFEKHDASLISRLLVLNLEGHFSDYSEDLKDYTLDGALITGSIFKEFIPFLLHEISDKDYLSKINMQRRQFHNSYKQYAFSDRLLDHLFLYSLCVNFFEEFCKKQGVLIECIQKIEEMRIAAIKDLGLKNSLLEKSDEKELFLQFMQIAFQKVPFKLQRPNDTDRDIICKHYGEGIYKKKNNNDKVYQHLCPYEYKYKHGYDYQYCDSDNFYNCFCNDDGQTCYRLNQLFIDDVNEMEGILIENIQLLPRRELNRNDSDSILILSQDAILTHISKARQSLEEKLGMRLPSLNINTVKRILANEGVLVSENRSGKASKGKNHKNYTFQYPVTSEGIVKESILPKTVATLIFRLNKEQVRKLRKYTVMLDNDTEYKEFSRWQRADAMAIFMKLENYLKKDRLII